LPATQFVDIPYRETGINPLYLGGGLMWEPMAITIMIGLLFGTVITLVFIPSLYSLLYKVDFNQYVFNRELLKG